MPNTLSAPPYLVLDACILMSGVLRPWLLELATRGLFEPRWSERIGREWSRNAARIWAVTPEVLDEAWQSMQQQFPAANVVPALGQPQIELRYSDAKDWHVIQTAWQVKQQHPQASVGVLTYNVKDFSRSELRALGLDLWDPDRFVCTLWPAHGSCLTETLSQTIEDLVEAKRRLPAPVSSFLKRERLFRLNKLMHPPPQ